MGVPFNKESCEGSGFVLEDDSSGRQHAVRCPVCNRRLQAKVRPSCSDMCGCGIVTTVVPEHLPKAGRTAKNRAARARELEVASGRR